MCSGKAETLKHEFIALCEVHHEWDVCVDKAG